MIKIQKKFIFLCAIIFPLALINTNAVYADKIIIQKKLLSRLGKTGYVLLELENSNIKLDSTITQAQIHSDSKIINVKVFCPKYKIENDKVKIINLKVNEYNIINSVGKNLNGKILKANRNFVFEIGTLGSMYAIYMGLRSDIKKYCTGCLTTHGLKASMKKEYIEFYHS